MDKKVYYEANGVPAWTVPLFQKKVDAANRKAERAGLGAKHFSLETNKTVRDVGGIQVIDLNVTVFGEPIGLPGWTFAAAVDWVEGGAVVRRHPVFTDNRPLRPGDKPICDHCGTFRHRNQTFLVVGPDNEVRQVGRQCLLAYTGIAPEWVMLDVEGISDSDYSGGIGDSGYDTLILLKLASRIIGAVGFKPTSAEEESTRNLVLLAYNGPRTKAEREQMQELRETLDRRTTEVDAEKEAQETIDWALSYRESRNGLANGYRENLQAILGSQRVPWRHVGLAVSAVQSYRREQERVKKRQEEALLPDDRPDTLGKEGERVSILVSVVRTREVSGYYGPSTVYSMVTPSCKAEISWFTSSSNRTTEALDNALRDSTVLRITGSIKSIGEYKGEPQIRLTRVAVK